ncbi:GTPases - Sulfate adenylate transferase subunit 1 [Methanosarcina siciliae T4/M]|uniref:GTPases-Sulfate adenylate transferase subunit 1 n=1 Tax=Methanosarcina siciliae T4/M TaxID=1434120 RepID=A0A0E3P763_9EURY|nr:hypothetical protein [Methanosarcina siciliae]AKB29699.1 GTPases - Sulfate adenylate transferase subunit 1 [Methanosarcina siciliae T4/M]
MNRNKIGVSILVLATLPVGMVLIPAVSAREEKDYSVTFDNGTGIENKHCLRTKYG